MNINRLLIGNSSLVLVIGLSLAACQKYNVKELPRSAQDCIYRAQQECYRCLQADNQGRLSCEAKERARAQNLYQDAHREWQYNYDAYNRCSRSAMANNDIAKLQTCPSFGKKPYLEDFIDQERCNFGAKACERNLELEVRRCGGNRKPFGVGSGTCAI